MRKLKSQNTLALLVTVAAGLSAIGCETPNPTGTGGAGSFRVPGGLSTRGASGSATSSWRWTDASSIDAGEDQVNNDLSASCTSVGGTLSTATSGCMQPAPVSTAGGRWFIGFNQDYLASPSSGVQLSALTAFANAGATFTALLGATLGVMDAGSSLLGAPVAPQTSSSSRYLRYAPLSNGGLAAVMYSEEYSGALVSQYRRVYSNIFDPTSRSWLGASALSTADRVTDRGQDAFIEANTFADRCKPSLSAAGDSTAMAMWCEYNNAPQTGTRISGIKWSRYASGAWSAGSDLIDVSTNLSMPAFTGASSQFELFASTTAGGTASRITNKQYIDVGDRFRVAITLNDTFRNPWVAALDPGVTRPLSYHQYYATVTATSSDNPGAYEFKIVTNTAGEVLMCPTLQNMANAMLSTKVCYDSTAANEHNCYSTTSTTLYQLPKIGAVQPTSLSQIGVSAIIDPTCDNTSTSNTTWDLSFYYNRGLNKKWRNATETFPAAGIDNTVSDVDFGLDRVTYNLISTSSSNCKTAGVTEWCDANSSGVTGFSFQVIQRTGGGSNVAEELAWQSAMVDLAGDAYGNYVALRSVAAPYFDLPTTSASITSSGVHTARSLVAHFYSGSTQSWRREPRYDYARTYDSTNPTALPTVLATQYVSRLPYCYNGSANRPCSVKDPKMLMADSGHGLALYYQNQFDPASSVATVKNPSRLWANVYDRQLGFVQSPVTIDADTICSATSLRNDTPVCETGDLSATSANHCQQQGEPVSAFPTAVTTRDIPPIAAAMNHAGQAIIAYHKKTQLGTNLSPSCSTVGTFVVTYDPSSGFGTPVQLDSLVGDAMHANVAIAENGDKAVVWEQLNGTRTEIYLRLYRSGAWQSIIEVNQGYTNNGDSAMPSVGIRSDGEVVVTFTYGPSGGTRRQYVRHYYVH